MPPAPQPPIFSSLPLLSPPGPRLGEPSLPSIQLQSRAAPHLPARLVRSCPLQLPPPTLTTEGTLPATTGPPRLQLCKVWPFTVLRPDFNLFLLCQLSLGAMSGLPQASQGRPRIPQFPGPRWECSILTPRSTQRTLHPQTGTTELGDLGVTQGLPCVGALTLRPWGSTA